jgi:hypothetical protein
MPIKCDCIDFIIPISNIEKVYEGGFEKFKSDYIELFDIRYQHDEFLFRDGAMNWESIQELIDLWEKRGLKGTIKTRGVYKCKDFCVFQSMEGKPTLPCDWLIFDPATITVSYKTQS